MLFSGTLTYKDTVYPVTVVEKGERTRTDIFKSKINLGAPSSGEVEVSVFEDISEGVRDYFGNLDLYFVVERLNRESRLYRFQHDEIETSDDFEEGKIIFTCTQRSERFEYNYKSENQTKVYKYLRTPEATLELTLADPNYILTNKHIQLSYSPVEIRSAEFNRDSIILSRIATVAELREKYDLSWLNNKNYIWVDNLDYLRQYCAELLTFDGIVAIDTETTGLNMYNYPEGSDEGDTIVSIVIAREDRVDEAIYIPLGHLYEDNLPLEETLDIVKPVVEKCSNLTQYGIYDFKVFMKYKMKLRIKNDTLIQAYIIEPNSKKTSKKVARGLKESIMMEFGIKQLSLSDLFPATKEGKVEIRYELLSKELALIYACPDVDLLIQLYKRRQKIFPSVSNFIYNVEIDVMPIVADAEFRGMRTDLNKFQLEKRLCEEVVEDLESLVYELAGYRLNLNSPDQVGNLIYNKLHCEKIVKSKSDQTKGSTGAKALELICNIKRETPSTLFKDDIVQEYIDTDGVLQRRTILKAKDLNMAKYPVVHVLMKYRDYSKLLSSFFNTIDDSNKGGWIFNWINQTGAQTGRIITPFQTFPAFIKGMIVGDSSDHGLIVYDMKQIELRLMFGLAKEVDMIEASSDPDNDIHRVAAGKIHQLDLWQVHKDIRKESKGLNFGIPYSLGDYMLAAHLYGYPVTDDKIEMAKDARRRYYEAMPRVERLFIDAKDWILKNGYIFTRLGRGFYYENILQETHRGKINRMLRQGGNGIIQGFCADVYKWGMVRIQKAIERRGWDKLVETPGEGWHRMVRQAMFVHDENVMPYNKKLINPIQVLAEIRDAAQIKMDGFPPFFIGASVVDNWGEGKEDKYEIPPRLMDIFYDEVQAGMHTEPIPNPREYVLERIHQFKEQSFRDYFDELKDKLRKEGKPVTAENLGKIFRHGVLVHDLVADFKMPNDYHKTLGRTPEHVDHIEYAVVKYCEKYGILESDTISLFEKPQQFSAEELLASLDVIDPKVNVVDLTIPDENDESKHFADSLAEYSNPIDVSDREFFDDADPEYEIDDDQYAALTEGLFDKSDYDARKQEIEGTFTESVLTVSRNKIITFKLVNARAVELINTYVNQQKVENGLYRVYYRRFGELFDTGIDVDRLDDVLIDLILSKTHEELNEMLDSLGNSNIS